MARWQKVDIFDMLMATLHEGLYIITLQQLSKSGRFGICCLTWSSTERHLVNNCCFGDCRCRFFQNLYEITLADGERSGEALRLKNEKIQSVSALVTKKWTLFWTQVKTKMLIEMDHHSRGFRWTSKYVCVYNIYIYNHIHIHVKTLQTVLELPTAQYEIERLSFLPRGPFVLPCFVHALESYRFGVGPYRFKVLHHLHPRSTPPY